MIKNKNTMKIKASLLSVAIIASVGSVFSFVKQGDDGMGDGGLMKSSQMAFVSPITTVITPKNNIEITFTANISIVNAIIKNNIGITVSQAKTDTSLDTNLYINIANLPTGSYTLILTDNKGATISSEKFTVD